jgi:hypothetical protein
MAQQNDDLSLGAGLIRKGEARGLSPALAAIKKEEAAPEPISPSPAPAQTNRPASSPAPLPPTPTAAVEPPASTQLDEDEVDPPLRAVPPDDVAKRFTSFRLPVSLDEDLRAMMFETRRSKQDLLIGFVTEGVRAWKRDRAKRG